MIPINEEAYRAFNDAVDTFTREQGIYPQFSQDGFRAEFDMKDEGYIYIFKLIGNFTGPIPNWKVIEGIK